MTKPSPSRCIVQSIPDEYKARRDALRIPQVEFVLQALHNLGTGTQTIKDICDETNTLLKQRYGKSLNLDSFFKAYHMARTLDKLEFSRADYKKNYSVCFWIDDDKIKRTAEFYGVEMLENKYNTKLRKILALEDWPDEPRTLSQTYSLLGIRNRWYKLYCSNFNIQVKEHIRNLCDRTCTICGKSTLQNIDKNNRPLGRLHVDHLDENKMQGCDDWEWRLTALCPSCHMRMRNQENHLLLRLLLLNNKKHQTNFLFGE